MREDEAGYDAQATAPPVQKWSGHVTVIDDAALDAVAALCGMTGVGLYAYLERRVGKDGSWTTTNQALAATFQCSIRHIRDAAGRLETHGFIVREEQFGPGGLTTGIRYNLPLHLRTNRAEPTPEPTPELSCARNKELSSYVVVTSKDVLSSESTAPAREPLPTKPKRAHRLPDGWLPSEQQRASLTTAGYSGVELETELVKFTNYHAHKGDAGLDWGRSFANWMAKSREFSPARSSLNGRASPNGVPIRYTLAEEREARRNNPLLKGADE